MTRSWYDHVLSVVRRRQPLICPRWPAEACTKGRGREGAISPIDLHRLGRTYRSPFLSIRCVKGLSVGSLPRAPAMGGRVHCGLEVYTQSALSRDKRTTGPVRQSTNPRPKHTCTTNIDCNRNGHDQLVCETHTLHGYTVVIVDRQTTVSVGSSGPNRLLTQRSLRRSSV